MGTQVNERILGELLQASHLMSFEQVPKAVADHAATAGVRNILIYVADLQQEVLRLATAHPEVPGAETAELRIDGTLAGRAYQSSKTLLGQPPDDRSLRWWIPLLDGTERLGVLRADTEAGSAASQFLESLAALVALLLVSKRFHSDSHARLVRTQPMTVSAEMQWTLMPPLTFANDRVVIGAAFEPAYEIGGDAFDYALAGDILHLAIFDAVGHDTASGLTANLAVAACRSHRRRGMSLNETSEAIARQLTEQFGTSQFATAILANLNTRTGLLSWINHGHHPPVVIRGGRWVTTIGCPPSLPLPLNVDLEVETVLCHEQLQPGDRLVLYTDGIIEARDSRHQDFGLDRFIDFIIRHDADGLPVPETLRRLIRHILTHHAGRLDDDATVLYLEWKGP